MPDTIRSTVRTLLIDDDTDLAQLLSKTLMVDHFHLDTAFNAADGLNKIKTCIAMDPYSLVLLDVTLPDGNGFDVLKKIRQISKVPIIMLTAQEDEIDRVIGLELGADDYLAKPVSTRELNARIKALLRRAQQQPEPHSDYQFGDLYVSKSRFLVSYSGQSIDLTPSEMQILICLVEHGSQAVARDQLFKQALGKSLTPYDRTLDMHISNLRKKLPRMSSGQGWITTIRGVGFRWEGHAVTE